MDTPSAATRQHQDQVPQVPTPGSNSQPTATLSLPSEQMMELRDMTARIEKATKDLKQVASTSQVKMTRKDKAIAAGICLGAVGVGVGGTLLAQRISRGRAAKKMSPGQ